MIIAQWTFKIPKNRLEDFLKYSRKKIKPFWESHGCKFYSVYQTTNKKLFPYQIMEDESSVTEHLVFGNIEDFEKFIKFVRENKEASEIAESYEKLFSATEIKLKLLKRVT
jgi:quinol monooxygenase YgiN